MLIALRRERMQEVNPARMASWVTMLEPVWEAEAGGRRHMGASLTSGWMLGVFDRVVEAVVEVYGNDERVVVGDPGELVLQWRKMQVLLSVGLQQAR